ncbi:hypothetical protein RSAG8_13801, partial [Rhizoctonia solani AG-8 WAC10335]
MCELLLHTARACKGGFVMLNFASSDNEPKPMATVTASPREKNFKLPPEFSGALRSALELSPLMGEITKFVEIVSLG